MKKKILALFLAMASIAAVTACNDSDSEITLIDPADFENSEATVSHTADPNHTYKDLEPVNGTYDAYGCTDLFHGDYSIPSSVKIIKDGKEITKDELKKGDIIAVYFSGVVASTYPGQPAGVTSIEVVTCDPADYKKSGGTSCMILQVNCLAYGIYANMYNIQFDE